MSSPRIAPIPFDLLPPGERPYFDRWGDGLVVVLPPRPPGAGGAPHGGAWVHLGAEGIARAFTGKVEVGQGTRVALSLLVAEELSLPLGKVDLVMGDTDVCPWDMGTFGSRSMADAGEHLRMAGAAMGGFLREIAASTLGLPTDAVALVDGHVRAKAPEDLRAIALGDLVKGLRRIESVATSTSPVPPRYWKTAGHPLGDPTSREVVTGTRKYTSDLRPEGMLQGAVLFPPRRGATLRHADLTRARAMPGVTVLQAGAFIAAAAPDRSSARAVVKAIPAEWELTPQPSETEIVEFLRSHPTSAEDAWDVIHQEVGDVDAALGRAAVTIQATYTAAYIAHVPMETHAVLASWDGDRVTVWLGTQTPFRARERIAKELGIAPSQVRVVVPPTGSGFGGKHAGELAVGAARLAREAGRPVQIAFSREEEFTQAYFRPYAVIEIHSGAEEDGTLVAWKFSDLNAGAAGARLPYAVAHQRIENEVVDPPFAQGSYRALAASANNFARESHIDELAHRFGVDPVEYRLRHLADDRLEAVLRAVVTRAGWIPRSGSDRGADGIGRGIAVGVEKGGRVATYVELRVHSDRRLKLIRIVTGYECGAIVHPTNLRSQVEGGTVMALGGALFEAIHFENGRILNPRLSQYRVPRFRDVPPIEVVLIDRPDLPSQGGGETPLIAVAPAIANAIHAATGERLRALPMVPEGVVP